MLGVWAAASLAATTLLRQPFLCCLPAACDDLAACLLPCWLDCWLAWRAGCCEPRRRPCRDDLAATTLAVGLPAACDDLAPCMPAALLFAAGWPPPAKSGIRKKVSPLCDEMHFFLIVGFVAGSRNPNIQKHMRIFRSGRIVKKNVRPSAAKSYKNSKTIFGQPDPQRPGCFRDALTKRKEVECDDFWTHFAEPPSSSP